MGLRGLRCTAWGVLVISGVWDAAAAGTLLFWALASPSMPSELV
jgi:hypothetical protein